LLKFTNIPVPVFFFLCLNVMRNVTDWLTNSMEQSPCWEASSYSGSQIPCLLWNPKVHYCVHKSLPLVPIPKPDDCSPHLPTLSLNSILISSHLHLDLPYDHFLSGFLTKIRCAFLIFLMHVTCPVHLILLDLITLQYLVKCTGYGALYCTVFSTLWPLLILTFKSCVTH